ncbi:MAG TPA: DUF885 domain-containing protein [Bacteroidota bacterium]|nr:DUF885 domain-containing protein [Bacteroidota bacterium]
MKNFLGYLAVFFLMIHPPVHSQTDDAAFSRITDEFLKGYFAAHPIYATGIGMHDYDSLLDDVSLAGRETEGKRLRLFREKLSDIDVRRLSPSAAVDHGILLASIDQMIFAQDELQEDGWNPTIYTGAVGDALAGLIYQDFAPADERLRNAAGRLRRIPLFIEQAEANLTDAPKLYVETAISQNSGAMDLIRGDLLGLRSTLTPDRQAEISAAADTALTALAGFGRWLEGTLLPRAVRDPRLGRALYEKKLRATLTESLTADEILARAWSEVRRIHAEMYAQARQLYGDYFHSDPALVDSLTVIRSVLDHIAAEHPRKEFLMDTIKVILGELEHFVAARNLLTLDPQHPIMIRETPAYERGVFVASMEAPGPLERNGKSYFNVTPVPDDWSPAQTESFLREYNSWSLRDLSIHEGIPGHYVQLYYANRTPSLIRSLFGSGAMVEGWAVYAERMMTDAGYMNGDPRMKLINLKWYLRTVLNAIIDQGYHISGMTEAEMTSLLMKEGFQEEREAAGKFRRAALTSVQLSTYFVGFQEVMDCRTAYEHRQGASFSLREFHEKFLSFGSIDVKYIRDLMMK